MNENESNVSMRSNEACENGEISDLAFTGTCNYKASGIEKLVLMPQLWGIKNTEPNHCGIRINFSIPFGN